MTLDYFFSIYFVASFMVIFPVLIIRGLFKIYKMQ